MKGIKYYLVRVLIRILVYLTKKYKVMSFSNSKSFPLKNLLDKSFSNKLGIQEVGVSFIFPNDRTLQIILKKFNQESITIKLSFSLTDIIISKDVPNNDNIEIHHFIDDTLKNIKKDLLDIYTYQED